MRYLVIITLIWAFSFSFIGEILAGRIDSYFAVLIRVILASLIFLPLTKFKGIDTKLKLKLMFIGSIQIGIMYIFFYKSFIFKCSRGITFYNFYSHLYNFDL